MLAGVRPAQRGRYLTRAAASWALGDDGPLYCLARRGGVWRRRGWPDALVACPAASSGGPGKRWRATEPRLCFSTLVCVCRWHAKLLGLYCGLLGLIFRLAGVSGTAPVVTRHHVSNLCTSCRTKHPQPGSTLQDATRSKCASSPPAHRGWG